MNIVIKRLIAYAFFFSFLLFGFGYVSARVGVGIGIGKIVVDKPLKPGIINELPPITIFNTGDEVTTYGIRVAYHTNQKEITPDRSWFKFEPAEFLIEPGKSQTVRVLLQIPIKAVPGDYFCYVEGHPIIKDEAGITSVGIAAATKLYFSISPANVLAGVYYRALSLWKEYHPWPAIVTSIIGIIVTGLLIKKFVKVEIKLSSPKSSRKKQKSDSTQEGELTKQNEENDVL